MMPPGGSSPILLHHLMHLNQFYILIRVLVLINYKECIHIMCIYMYLCVYIAKMFTDYLDLIDPLIGQFLSFEAKFLLFL